MGKQVTESAFELKTWEEVDTALREIAECEISLNEVDGNMNIAINDAKEIAAKLAKPMQTRIKTLQVLVKAFVETNKADISGKTKVLNFGKVGFRQTSRVSVPTKQIDAIIENLRKHGMGDCIVTKETINKEVLEKYPDNEIIKVGASRKIDDKFWMETDKTKIGRN